MEGGWRGGRTPGGSGARSGRGRVPAARAGRRACRLPAPRRLPGPAPQSLFARRRHTSPFRAQLAAAQPAAPGPRLETGSPLVLLEGHRGPERAQGPRRLRSLVAVLASPFTLTSSVLASRLFISAPVSQQTALRPARTPCAPDARGVRRVRFWSVDPGSPSPRPGSPQSWGKEEGRAGSY